MQTPMAAAVLSLVTFGIYFLVLLRRWATWRDGWDGRGSASRWARWGIWLTVASVLALVLGYVAFFALMVTSDPGGDTAAEETVVDGDQAGGPPDAFFAVFIVFWLVMMVASAGLLAGRIFLFVAQWKVWDSLQGVLVSRGRPPRLPPIALLMIEIFGPQVMQFLVMVLFFVAMFGIMGASSVVPGAPFLLIPLVLGSLLLVALPLLYVIAETQKRVLEVAGARVGGPRPA